MIDTTSLLVESWDEYCAMRVSCLTSHSLADFRACPLLYDQKRRGLISDRDSTSFLLGRALHTLVLEGRRAYENTYAIGGPINEKTGKHFGRETKAFAEWAAGCGKPVLSPDQAELINAMASSVLLHSQAAGLLADGVGERVARVGYGGIWCQGRLDWVAPHHGIVELKTCDDLTWFESDVRKYGYTHQVAFYRGLLREVCGETAPAHLIAVEKRAPFRCGVWRIADQVLDGAWRENLVAMDRLKRCQQTNIWPTGYEDIRTICDAQDEDWTMDGTGAISLEELP
jgi:hypothetical protein